MKTFATFVLVLFLGNFLAGAAENQTSQPVNFYLFSNQEKKVTEELLKRTPEEFKGHPDLGKLPASSPCRDCFEDVSVRKSDARYFISNGSDGAHFYKQQSVGAINYKDAFGQWREINPALEVPAMPGEFHASRQPNPVSINMNGKVCSIESRGYKLEFNRMLELFHLDHNRNMVALGKPDWTNYTAGDGGIKVTDFYPGIDLELIVYEGKLKTNFILNRKLNYTDGWLIMKQEFALPGGLQWDASEATTDERGKLKGEMRIVDETGEAIFTIKGSLVHDNAPSQSSMMASSDFNQRNQFFVYVPCSWLSNPSLVYPVTIDPLVTATGSMAQAAIAGSGYTPACYSGGCTYNMASISVPASCTVTDVTTNFSYLAGNACTMKDGGIIVHYGSCRAPSSMAFLNGSDVAGNASISASLMPYIQNCIPAPQCSSYTMDFSMDFYRCKDNSVGCNANCISANSAWVVTVEGHTVEINTITPDHIVCTGGSTTLTATASNGVGPYSYSWSPGGAGQTISPSPAGTTVYSCTATDACGMMTTSACTATVTSSAPPSVSITPSGTVCAGTNITFTAVPNNGGSAPNYDWYIGSLLQQSGPLNVFTTTVSSSDSISVQMTSNSPCALPSIASAGFSIASTPASSVVLSSIPSSPPYCVGQTVILTATPLNGGPNPIYGWGIGAPQSGIFLWTTSNTFSYVVQAGVKSFKTWMVSSLPCVSNDTVGSPTRTIAGTALTQPNVTLFGPGTICQGDVAQFTTNSFGGGASPSYAWYLNGVLIPGATNSTYSIVSLSNGDVVSVVLTSNASCLAATSDTDSITVTVVPVVIPTVTITAVPGNPICPDECVFFNASVTLGGPTPSFQWKWNGTNVGINSDLFSSCSLSNGDSVSVTMTSNSPCAISPTSAATYFITAVIIDTTVAVNGSTLTANEQGALYQWLYCDSGMTAVSGATGQSYTPVLSGTYSVRITQSGCTDTSACYPVVGVGIEETGSPENLLVYPNPATESITIKHDALANGTYEMNLIDILGKSVFTRIIRVKDHRLMEEISLKNLSPGIYFLKLSSDSHDRIFRITKQ